MTASGVDAMVRGWCPGALRPMESGDGLIVRLRISLGVVGIALAEEIARWSRRWGNGQIDLTNRGNLQLRGLSVRHLPELHDALAECGLLESSEASEAVCNVIASPLAGLDPAAVLDVRPIASALEKRLAGNASLHGLPGKFGFAIDDGGSLNLDDVAADIRFVARSTPDGPVFEIHLAGAPRDRFGPCRPDALVDVAEVLSRVFLRLRTGRHTGIRRMRGLVAACGSQAIGREAGLALVGSPHTARVVHPPRFPGCASIGCSRLRWRRPAVRQNHRGRSCRTQVSRRGHQWRTGSASDPLEGDPAAGLVALGRARRLGRIGGGGLHTRSR